MSLQWLAVATYFYAEVLVVLLLCSPFIGQQKWQWVFSSRPVLGMLRLGQPFCGLLLLILGLLFMNALGEMTRLENLDKSNVLRCRSALEHYQVHILRAQKNLHITGFALLLSLLLGRLASLHKQLAALLISQSLEEQRRDENERLQEEAAARARLRVSVELCENETLRANLRKLSEELEVCRKKLGSAQDELLEMRKRPEERVASQRPGPEDPMWA